MADPRDVLSHTGNHARFEAFKHDSTIVYDRTKAGGSAQVGLAVTMAADDQVTLIGDGERLLGKLIGVEPGGVCAVQVAGFMRLPAGDSATVTVGSAVVGDLGASSAEGYIQTAPAAGATYAAAEVNLLARARGIISNNDVTTAVVVYLP